jgi:hypothetical protein
LTKRIIEAKSPPGASHAPIGAREGAPVGRRSGTGRTMSEERRASLTASTRRYAGGFWDEVEREVEALDWRDLAEFLAAPALPIEPRPGFEEELRAELRLLVRRHFSV